MIKHLLNRKQLVPLFFVLIVSSGCGNKYEMTNSVPEAIDVTEYIESGEFYPDSCDGRLDKLIKTHPRTLDQSYEVELQKKLNHWKNEYNNWLKENSRDTIVFEINNIVSNTSYQYSYFITDDPIDVYRTDTEIELNEIKKFSFFIRIDKAGNIFSDYKEDGWIFNNCDSINSIIQNIYSPDIETR